MKKELQNKLFESYPKIFRQKDLDKTVSAMCYGIGCGDGWYSLIDTMCGNIKNQMDNVNRNKPDYTFTLLCNYYTMSYRICSQCGNASTPNEKKRGWIYTLCNNCKVT